MKAWPRGDKHASYCEAIIWGKKQVKQQNIIREKQGTQLLDGVTTEQ